MQPLKQARPLGEREPPRCTPLALPGGASANGPAAGGGKEHAPRPPQLIVPLSGKGPDLAKRAQAMVAAGVTVVEWRVDTLEHCHPQEALAVAPTLREELGPGIYLLATVRARPQGGQVELPTAEYENLVLALAGSGQVDAVDVETPHLRPPRWLKVVHDRCHVFGSVHYWDAGPAHSEQVVADLAQLNQDGVDVLKVAYYPQNATQTVALLGGALAGARQFGKPQIVIGMGPWGLPTRLVGPDFGNSATFVAFDSEGASAPGQLDLATARKLLKVSN